ncbi:hypothetical protein DIURU_004633 [Diutina rugosa]|uniref:Uncharacterized protein n=1 Tax=Diutina rugosa TaxID=5481 RepID=A0A642UGP1_DIURU|nr:uncharacterized protein DIURU_004633 [Diutina rugosa]KAA8898613.1 hypothetical protein DIURU_004633 [Diutina rugosa]
MAPKRGSTNSTKAAQKAAADTGPETNVDKEDTARDAREDRVDDSEVEEIAAPKSTKKKPTGKKKACTKVFYPSAGDFSKRISAAKSIEDKEAIYAEWLKDLSEVGSTNPVGYAGGILTHIHRELTVKMETPELELLLNFTLKALKHSRFTNISLQHATNKNMQAIPGLLLKQRYTDMLEEAIRCILNIGTEEVRGLVEVTLLDAVPKITSREVFEVVLPIVLSGEIDLASDTAVAQVQTILSKAKRFYHWTLSDMLKFFGQNLDEYIKECILNTGTSSSSQTPQNEVSPDESSAQVPREQSNDGNGNGEQPPDQSSHGQRLTPPQQRSPPNSQGKSAKTQANRLSQKSASTPGAHVVEHHNDTPPPPSPSMEASPSTGIPELLRNEPILSGPQYQPRKRRHPTNFASNKKPQNKNSRLSPGTVQAVASGSHSRTVGSHPRLAEQPHISEILSALNDRPFNYVTNQTININYCVHGDSGILESRSSTSTVDNQELVNRGIKADDGYEDAGHDDEGDDDGYVNEGDDDEYVSGGNDDEYVNEGDDDEY